MSNRKSPAEVLAKYLTTRMRTVAEAKKHLRDKEYSEDEIEETIRDFMQRRYLNDADYVHAYCNYAYDKKRGRKRIRRELEQRGIDSDVIDNGIEDYIYENQIDEDALAMLVAEKVLFGERRPIEQKLIARVARKLEGLGYSSGTIMHVLGKIKE